MSVEHALRDLGRAVEFPPEPDLAPAVLGALRLPARRARPRWALVALAAALLALAVALAVPPARSAILDLLRIGGVTVERAQTLPDLPDELVPPGRPASLAEAGHGAAFPLAVPEGYGAVYLDETAPGGMVTFVWADRQLSQFLGDDVLLKKVVETGTRTEWVTVNGRDGLWIEGARHAVQLPGGDARLAGNVLIWTRGGVTFRLEGAVTRAQALRIAGTLAPPQT